MVWLKYIVVEIYLILPFVTFLMLNLGAISHLWVKHLSILVFVGEFVQNVFSNKQPVFLWTDFLNPFPQEKEHVDHELQSAHWLSKLFQLVDIPIKIFSCNCILLFINQEYLTHGEYITLTCRIMIVMYWCRIRCRVTRDMRSCQWTCWTKREKNL